jgi:hypothetical protein
VILLLEWNGGRGDEWGWRKRVTPWRSVALGSHGAVWVV